MANQTTREQIEDMQLYDPCVHISPARFATLLLAVLNLAEAVELSDFTKGSSFLPKTQGPFLYEGLPVHQRAIEHSGKNYIVFCTTHSGTAGNVGSFYITYVERENGSFQFYQKYTSSTVTDWIKRAMNEATATTSYPGQMSVLMYKRLDAVYKFCVAQGMAEVN